MEAGPRAAWVKQHQKHCCHRNPHRALHAEHCAVGYITWRGARSLSLPFPVGMIAEFMVPLATLSCAMVVCIASLDQLCQFHQIYQATASRLDSERWLLGQCEDPHFFSKMHMHTDICFQVENNARVGAFMLALREVTHTLLASDILARVAGGWVHRLLFSWPAAIALLAVLLLGPTWSVSRYRSLQRRWPEVRDGHFKDA